MFAPRSIFITGASSGIGAALAIHYAKSGVTLFLNGRSRERLEELARAARVRGAAVYVDICDVTDETAMKRAIADSDAIAPLDLVIANAGISGGTGAAAGSDSAVMAEPAGQAHAIFATNVTGVLNTIEPAIALMGKRGKGQIAIMSSLASFNGWPGAPAYSASKAAVRVYGEALRGKLAKRGISVSVICPGFIRTPMTEVNPYKMPFLMEPEKAAQIIGKGLAKGHGRIAFPWPVYWFSRALGLLPLAVSLPLLARTPEKPAHGG
jgi:short-subunit dehydrogenase